MTFCTHTPTSRRRLGGTSLLQLAVAVAVLATLSTLALPHFQALLDRQRAAAARHLLSSTLAAARLAAIQRHADVTVCASADGQQCSSDARDWSQGWLTYAAPHGQPGAPAAQAILDHQQWARRAGWRIESTAGRPRIRYLGSGRAHGTNLTLQLCRHDHLYGRVVVSNSGRVRSETHDTPGGCPP